MPNTEELILELEELGGGPSSHVQGGLPKSPPGDRGRADEARGEPEQNAGLPPLFPLRVGGQGQQPEQEKQTEEEELGISRAHCGRTQGKKRRLVW